MKNLSKSISIAVMCMMLVACRSKPSGMSEEDYDAGCEMLDVVDSFLDDDVTANEALGKIQILMNGLDKEEHNGYMVYLDGQNLTTFLRDSSSKSTGIKEARDGLAKHLRK